jgi:hypothetical protein
VFKTQAVDSWETIAMKFKHVLTLQVHWKITRKELDKSFAKKRDYSSLAREFLRAEHEEYIHGLIVQGQYSSKEKKSASSTPSLKHKGKVRSVMPYDDFDVDDWEPYDGTEVDFADEGVYQLSESLGRVLKIHQTYRNNFLQKEKEGYLNVLSKDFRSPADKARFEAIMSTKNDRWGFCIQYLRRDVCTRPQCPDVHICRYGYLHPGRKKEEVIPPCSHCPAALWHQAKRYNLWKKKLVAKELTFDTHKPPPIIIASDGKKEPPPYEHDVFLKVPKFAETEKNFKTKGGSKVFKVQGARSDFPPLPPVIEVVEYEVPTAPPTTPSPRLPVVEESHQEGIKIHQPNVLSSFPTDEPCYEIPTPTDNLPPGVNKKKLDKNTLLHSHEFVETQKSRFSAILQRARVNQV